MNYRKLIGAVLLSSALLPTVVHAQGLTNFSSTNRAQAISEMTDVQLFHTLRSTGRVSMSGTFFKTDSAVLDDRAEAVLSKLTKAMEQFPDTRLAVIGHTDNVGDFNYNVQLSKQRAEAIVAALAGAPHNIAADRLVSIGVGSIDPIASNLSDEGKAINRRVSFVLLGDTIELDDSAVLTKGGWLIDPVTGCEIWTAGDAIEGEGAVWTGACLAGKASGRGSLIFWDANGLEARYDGDVVGGRLDGSGVLAFRNDETGEFDYFDGEFYQGAPKGEGVLVASNGYTFEGELISGVTHGNGTLTTPDGAIIQGEIKDGEGVGSLLVHYESEDGELYFGDVENNQRHGFGVLVSANDDYYAGDFVKGAPSGSGLFEGADGSQFIGTFASGSPNGVGTAIDVEGTSYQGVFNNGVADGQILVTTADGAQSVETWTDGEKAE